MQALRQAIDDFEQQLRELTYTDGTKVYDHIYIYGIPAIDRSEPCAIITAQSSTEFQVTSYIWASDRKQAEMQIVAMADLFRDRGIHGRHGWITQSGTVYRTFTFVRTVPEQEMQ